MVEVFGDGHVARLGRVVGADRVMDPAAFAGNQVAVVAGVIPREHVRLHRVHIQFFVKLQDLLRLV
jgi:hypothetical protein